MYRKGRQLTAHAEAPSISLPDHVHGAHALKGRHRCPGHHACHAACYQPASHQELHSLLLMPLHEPKMALCWHDDRSHRLKHSRALGLVNFRRSFQGCDGGTLIWEQDRLYASPLKWLLGRSHAPAFARAGTEHTEGLKKLSSAIPAWKHRVPPAPSSQSKSDQLC